mgnify:FL=1
MKQMKLTKANLEKLALNPPAIRDEYRTDIPGCYVRAGPSSLSLAVIRRDEGGDQRRVTIALDPLCIPSLPELKPFFEQSKDNFLTNVRRSEQGRGSLKDDFSLG